jgi:hypothetical protein
MRKILGLALNVKNVLTSHLNRLLAEKAQQRMLWCFG